MEANEPVVYVVDDDPAVRQSVQWLLESVARKVETFESAQAFIDAGTADRFGCLITDVRMPGVSGLQLLETIRENRFMLPVIVLTAHGDVMTAVRAMKAGAFDFLEKPVNDQKLLDLIESAIEHDRKNRQAQKALSYALDKFETLTPREKDVMKHVVDGLSNKEIARTLDISPKTVEAHRAKVNQKMAADSLADLVKLANVCF